MILSVVLAALLSIPALTHAQEKPSVQEQLSKASLPLYIGKQICKWNPKEGLFGTDWTWGCKFESEAICTATVIDRQGNEYVALTAGHCIMPAIREANGYYISDEISDEPVLHHVDILKSENDDRYDYAIISFHSAKEYPVIPLNNPNDGSPAVGTELLNVNYSYGLGKQVVHGIVTSEPVNVDAMKKRFLTTLQTGPGSSGSAIVDAKTGEIVGVLELGFPLSAMGAGAIPTGKNLSNFLEDDTAGLPTPPAVGQPPMDMRAPKNLTVGDHFKAIWAEIKAWLIAKL